MIYISLVIYVTLTYLTEKGNVSMLRCFIKFIVLSVFEFYNKQLRKINKECVVVFKLRNKKKS